MGTMHKLFFLAIYFLFAKYLPKSNARIVGKACKSIRRCIAKRFVLYCGRNVNFQQGAIFSSRLKIGDNSSLGVNSVVQGPVTIGCNVMMGPEVFVYTKNHCHDRIDIPMILQGYEDEKPVCIEDDVWIGSRVTILPGVTISKGVIIGASAVVTKNVPAYSVVAGNPAIIVKRRS